MIRDTQSGWSEAEVTINGQPLTFAESMTLRVAVTSWLMFVADKENKSDLGSIADGYEAQCRSIFQKMTRDK